MKEFLKLAIFDVNQTIFNLQEIKLRFKKKKINPLFVDFWFSNILKEGFASSKLNKFVNFQKIATEELKKLNSIKKNQDLLFFLNGFKNLRANMGIREGFELLKKNKIKIATLTNGPKKNSINLLKKNKLLKLVDNSFSIEDVGIWKPNPEPYEYVAKHFKLKPQEIIMIAAHGWDINGAKSVGMKTGYINSFEGTISTYYKKPDYEAKNCLQLVKKITS